MSEQKTPKSRKIKAAIITMSYVVAAMVVASALTTPVEIAKSALYIIGGIGGVTVGGQAWVDRFMGSQPPKA